MAIGNWLAARKTSRARTTLQVGLIVNPALPSGTYTINQGAAAFSAISDDVIDKIIKESEKDGRSFKPSK